LSTYLFLDRIAVCTIITDRVATGLSVYLSVCGSVCHTSEPCKNRWTDRDAVCVEDSSGFREPLLSRGSMIK